jgi:dTDP-glucose pyrophosphorylase/predicted transcriptional regulator
MEKKLLSSLLISPSTTIKEAIQRLNETGQKILFVADSQEKLLGTLTDGDIRRAIIGGLVLTSSVEAVMKMKFFSLTTDTPNLFHAAKRLMQQHSIEQIPVVNSNGVIVDVMLWLDFLTEEKPLAVKSRVSMDNPVVIMAGGKGTRLDPFTKILPKPLIPLGDKPIVENIMDRFYENGFSRFVLIVNYKKEMIKAYFSENTLPYDITFVEEQDFYGTAGGLFLLRGVIKQSFIVTNCDTILEGNYLDFYQWHCDQKNIMTIVGSHKEITVPYGVLCMNNGVLEKIDEKPKLDLFINTGTYILEPSIFEFIEDRKQLDMDILIREVQALRIDRVGVYPHWGGWFDIGQWAEYQMSLKELGHV